MPRIDAIRNSLKVIEIKGLEALHHSVIRTSIQNKLVRNGTIDGYKVVAFDGVELFESTKKSCDNCLTRVIENVPHYFHRSVVGAYFGQDPHIIIGQEMLKPKLDSASKDEGELSAAKRLLRQLHKQHRHFADVIVYDAHACNAPWGIENNIFRQLKTEWHMNHCFIHHKNGLEAALMFMIISFN